MISNWKRWLLPAYYYGSLPLRRFGSSLASAIGQQPIAVVFYHRVSDEGPNPWTISNAQFTQQIDWLAKNFDLVSLVEAQRRLREGDCRRPAVSITFDDGYAENCQRALPMLVARKIPFTYFVSTQFVQRGEPFPHDVQRGEPRNPNTVEQLRSLAAAGVEIGAHTRTHADLGPVKDADALRHEIVGSRDDLQNWIGQRVRYFAFPFGQYANLNTTAFQIAIEAGFDGVCSAYGGYNLPGDDAFHLQRLHADPDFSRFRNWLNYEPRILTAVKRYKYDSATAVPKTDGT